MSEKEDEKWDINTHVPDDEEDNRMLRRVFHNYFPSPGDFHCYDCSLQYLDRLDRLDERYFKEHGLKWEDAYGPADGDLSTSSEMDTTEAPAIQDSNVSSTPKSAKNDGKGQKGKRAPKVKPPAKPQQKVPATGKKGIERGQQKKASTEKVDQKGETDENGPISDAEEPKTSRSIPRGNQVWCPIAQQYHGRLSLFTVEEHKKYIAMLCNLQAFGKYRFTDNAALYEKMKDRLNKETVKFNEFVQEASKKSLVHAHNALPKAIRDYIKSWKDRKASIVTRADSLPGRYRTSGIHYITLPMQDPPELNFLKQLLVIGKAPRICLPDMTRKAVVPMENTKMVDDKFLMSEKGNEILLNKDANFKPLLEKYRPQFVASSSAVRSLILWRGPLLSDVCELPVVVEPHYLDGRRERIVFISKPLPPRGMSKHQCRAQMAKYAVKAKLIDPKFDLEKARAYSGKEAPSTSDLFDQYDPDAVETFTQSVERGAITDNEEEQPKKRTRGRPRSASISRSGKSFDGSMPTEQSQKPMESATEGEVLDRIMSDMSIPSKKAVGFQLPSAVWNQSESAASENPNQYHEPEKYGCLRQYSLFTLKDYQILLRSNIDGVIRSPGGGGGGGHTSISAKVEYQPTFGAEMQTDDEIAYEWLTAYLKQSDVHCRVRVKCDRDYDILALDKLTKDVHLQLQSFANSKFSAYGKIKTGMRQMHFILRQLSMLDEGKYLVHFKSSEEKVAIYRAVAGSDEFREQTDIDLRRAYLTQTDARLPHVTFEQCWRNIDPDAPLQWHRIMKRIPATFPPRKEDEEPNLSGNKSNKSNKKKRKWKRRGRQNSKGRKQVGSQESQESDEGDGESGFSDE